MLLAVSDNVSQDRIFRTETCSNLIYWNKYYYTVFNRESKYALILFNSEGNLIKKNLNFQFMVYKSLSVIKSGFGGLHIRQSDKFMAQPCNLCIHLSASESFPSGFLPQALQWSAGHNKQNSFLYQQDHDRTFKLKGKRVVKFSDSGLLWEWRDSWNRLAGPETCDTPRSMLYFWSFKAVKRDLKNHSENSVTTALSES